MKATDLNQYIKKSHIKAVEKFAAELAAFAKETGDEAPELYEDQYTWFTLANVRLENGFLLYEYDGVEENIQMVYKESERYSDGEDIYIEEDGVDSITEYLKWFRSCLRRAKRYWSMDTETLDALQNGEVEDEE